MELLELSSVTKSDNRHAPKGRSRLSNSLFAIPGISGKSVIGRRYRDLIIGLLSDMGVSEDELSNAIKLQLRQAASLAVQIELAQVEAMNGKSVDTWSLIRQQNTLSRLLWQLGLGPRRRSTLGPDEHELGEYLDAKGAKRNRAAEVVT